MSPRPDDPSSTHRLRVTAIASIAVVLAVVSALLVGLSVAPAQAERYTPKAGVTFNDPLAGRARQNKILDQVLDAVGAAPSGSRIRFASWNIRGSRVVDALVKAHRRGVVVRVVMDRKNAYYANPNVEVERLADELEDGRNGRLPVELQSGLRKCKASCRGKTGFAHSKFFLFSQSGKAEQVVINSSANATDLSATNQWNDAFTVVGDTVIYDAFTDVFDAMYADQPVQDSYGTATSGSVTASFFPYHGTELSDRDPVVQELDPVVCSGATNASGGRTRIEISMTSWFGDRGLQIAEKVRDLARQGCRIKIAYAVAGNEVLRMMRRADIPLRHIVQDFDRDGVYDRYLHQKVLTIRGNYDGDAGSWVTYNGSANWSPLSLVSDEANLKVVSEHVVRRYHKYIARLFRNPPPNRPASGSGRGPRGAGGDEVGLRAGVSGADVRPGRGAYAEVAHD